jgi:hypothetical protein
MFFQLMEQVDEVREHVDWEVDLLTSLVLSGTIIRGLGDADTLDFHFIIFHWVDGRDLEHAVAVHPIDGGCPVKGLVDREELICLRVEDVVDGQGCCRMLRFGPCRCQKEVLAVPVIENGGQLGILELGLELLGGFGVV